MKKELAVIGLAITGLAAWATIGAIKTAKDTHLITKATSVMVLPPCKSPKISEPSSSANTNKSINVAKEK